MANCCLFHPEFPHVFLPGITILILTYWHIEEHNINSELSHHFIQLIRIYWYWTYSYFNHPLCWCGSLDGLFLILKKKIAQKYIKSCGDVHWQHDKFIFVLENLIFLSEIVKSWFYQALFNYVEFKLPCTWALATWGLSCGRVALQFTWNLLTFSSPALTWLRGWQSTVCAIAPAMFN